jgi:penicillin G amidase
VSGGRAVQPLKRGLIWLAAAAALLIAVGAAAILLLRQSLAQLDGRARLPGLESAVEIEHDRNGVPTLIAASRADLARALGYLHAQDRYFQMDLLRRAAAGELSALLGPATLDADRRLRVHRFRAVAQAALAAAPAAARALLDAYAQGVNAGLNALASRPPEYWLLGITPEPWQPEDSLLVVHAMFLQLQEPDGHSQIQRGLLRAALPESAVRFIYAQATDWESTLDGSRSPPPELPSAADYDLRKLETAPVEAPAPSARHGDTGSNGWAIAGRRSASGGALLASDMHLDLRVPNTWYRARLIEHGDEDLNITGVTLPGTPTIVAGSNGHLAWGFTNSYGDFEDVVVLVPGAGRDEYLTAHGPETLRTLTETIRVRGAAPVALTVLESSFGPVIDRDAEGRALALAWTAQDPAAINLNLIGLERANSVADALPVAAVAGIPAQNLQLADRAGHIGWTIAGLIPVRHGAADRGPVLSTDPAAGLGPPLAAADRPSVVDPPDGWVWTANNRVVGGAGLELLGDGGYDRGSRATQIHDDLVGSLAPLRPRDSLAIQLDDRARFLERWRALLVELLDGAAIAGHPQRRALKETLLAWTQHAATDDAAYRAVRAFRSDVETRVFAMLVAPARARSPAFHFSVPASFEGPLWLLVTQRPPHLLARHYGDWHEFLLSAADAAASVPRRCTTLARCTWGRVNVLNMAHPLSAAVPLIGFALDMPHEELPGDNDMPRVQGPQLGASVRFDVAPGQEAEGLFEMPGGQSGHFLSPYYRSGHGAWAHGRPEPFLPGPPRHHLSLAP